MPSSRVGHREACSRRWPASDRRSFAQLATRFPADPAGAFFLSMAEGEGLALGLLQNFATAVGVGPDWLAAYEPSPDC